MFMPSSAIPNSAVAGYFVCIRNDGVPASLEVRKIYAALPDSDAGKVSMLRIVDESGEDYLFPSDWFVPIELDRELAWR
jgi:hypothetical protein